MLLGIKNLLEQINQRLNQESLPEFDRTQLLNAKKILVRSSYYSVQGVNNLPSAPNNKGRFVYIENICDYRYSDGNDWISIYLGQVAPSGSQIWAWGFNGYGNIGVGATGDNASPRTTIGNGLNWCSAGVGAHNSAAIKKDGTIWTWGRNHVGQLGDGTVVNKSSPVSIIGVNCNWIKVYSGNFHVAGLKNDGTLWTWGYNTSGQLGDNTTANKCSPVTVIAGGNIWCQISLGGNHSLGIKTDGTLWAWGANANGRLGDNTATNRASPVTTAGGGTDWCQVNAGGSSGHSLGIKSDGTLWTWGLNNFGQLGDGTTTSRSSPATTAGGGTNWSRVFGGQYHSLAIKSDGMLWSWGSGAQGEKGDNVNIATCSPGTVFGGGTNWCWITAGLCVSAAIKTDSTLWVWGSPANGRHGDGTGSNRFAPVPIAGGGFGWCHVDNTHATGIATRIVYRGFE